MTDLQKAFCQEYIIDYNISNAAKRAGYKEANSKVTGWQVMQLPEVQQYIETLQNEASKRCQISKDIWLAEWKKLGFSNIENYLDDEYIVKPLSKVKHPEVIKSVKKTITPTELGSKTTIEITLHDKVSALVNIGKHLGYFSEDNSQKILAPEQKPPVINVYNVGPPLASSEDEIVE